MLEDNIYVMEGDPKTGNLEIPHLILATSYACNLHCNHCINEDGREKDKSLELKDWQGIIDEFAEISNEISKDGRAIAHLKGGEPFVDNKTIPLMRYITEKGLHIFITTNGTILTEKVKAALNTIPKNKTKILVSLDGPNEEVNAKIRGPRNFAKPLSFVRYLNSHDIPFDINYVVHRDNIGYLEQIVDLAMEEGASQINLIGLIERGNALALGLKKADPDKFVEKLEEIYEMADEKKNKILTGSIIDIMHNYSKACVDCTLGYKGFFYITPTGDVYSCPSAVFSEFNAGNIKEGLSLRGAMNSRKFEILRKGNNILKGSSYGATCKGEKMFYESKGLDCSKLYRLAELINVKIKPDSKKRISICSNRNW